MPKPFKPTRPFALPPSPDLVDVDGKPHVRMKERGRPVLYPLTKDRTKYLRPAKRWYFELRDDTGTVKRVKGFADLKATEQLAAELERKAARTRVGIIDPTDEHLRRPLAEHLTDYAGHLEAKACTPAHVRLALGRVSALFSGCRFVFPLDADAGKAAEWLAALRRNASPVTIPEGDSFTPGEVAELLGISGTAVRAAVKRLELCVTGNGKARRLPHATVEALVINRAKGCGPETVNHYIRAVRGFFGWLVKAKRMGANPLGSLELVSATADVRRARRELSADELRRLFEAARTSARAFRGLTGTDRYFLYLTAAGTGFRASALANLTPNDFDLDTDAPTVTLAARFNKSRKLKVQPLPADVAAALRDYLRTKVATAPMWGGTWARDHRGAEMIRGDLEVAGIAYTIKGPDGPLYADFHALRHSFLTLGGRSGIDLRTLQELAGHSKPELTARYSHRRLNDLTGAVAKLPNLVPTEAPETNAQTMRATGTDVSATFRKDDNRADSGAVPGAVSGRAASHQSASSDTLSGVRVNRGRVQQTLEMQGAGASQHRPASIGTSEDDGTRTRNHRRDKPKTHSAKAYNSQHIPCSTAPGCSAGCSDQQDTGCRADPALAALVAAWPTLPDHIRAAIRALVGTVVGAS